MPAVLIDIDGALYVGERKVTGADDATMRLEADRVPYLLLTNTTSCPRAALVEKLANMGIDVAARVVASARRTGGGTLDADARVGELVRVGGVGCGSRAIVVGAGAFAVDAVRATLDTL